MHRCSVLNVIVALGLLSACSSGGDVLSDEVRPPGNSTASPSTSTNATFDEENDASISALGDLSELDVELTPAEVEGLLAYAGFHVWDQEEFQEQEEARVQAAIQREEFIYSCMTARGFEYFPARITGIAWTPFYSVDAESDEWVDVYGIGFSTTILPQVILGESATGYVGDPPPVPDISPDSPETQYLNSLPAEEFAAYSRALSGIEPGDLGEGPTSPDAPLAEPTVDGSSCQVQANNQFPGPPGFAQPEKPFHLWIRIQATPVWRDFMDRGWGCVRSQGHDFRSLDNVKEAVRGFLEENGFYHEIGQIERSMTPIPEHIATLLAEGQDYERELASVLWECDVHLIQQRVFAQELFGSLATAS